ncbi:hypothetical protein [Sulfurimonas sp.]|uniref:hypothetical protein n=1 Tax=Sulfurimonas sp. TaxID=2022749 RepID=UPI0025F6E190|nr:hypothetical protein [Sulfurimonas sp.]
MKLVKTKFSIVLAIFLINGTFVIANESKEKPKLERGFRFGDVKESKDEKLKEKSSQELLVELVKLSKKQLIEQTRIREILENEFDPQQKIMTLPDGTECVENSSSKCFKMPVINSIKKIPAIANAYKNPSLENVKTREMWYGTYVLNVLKDSYLKGQAIRELGPKYPLATKPLGTINNVGYDSLALKNYRKSLVDKQMPIFELNIFIGLNKSLDMYSLVRLAYLVKDNPTWNFNLVFNSYKSKEDWEKQYKNFYVSKHLKRLNAVIQPEAFEEFKVYTTPSFFLKDKKKSKDTLIFVGRATQADIVSRVIEYMIQSKYIKRNELTASKAWSSKSSEQVVENYFNGSLGIKYEK